ncbi:recombinase RecT [Magnetospirillum aberrantis]|uniref:Recombinase RecT n=1 Tax=Magnetospirillum aberrantis SpK TaxID=908842 RepID=A0A7C9UVI4_9PROT|nr:recombinase RecT [Magnetospirillum aberrantis]NFV80049.1 recombinase RecT [Magnetospirillum aberrantis SpK]
MSNAVTKAAEQNISVGFTNAQSFEFSQRAAQALAASTLVPEQFRRQVMDKRSKNPVENPNAVPNCIIALNMANRMGADPLMVMQNLYVVEGRPSWSAQFVIAAINSCGRFSPLRFDLSAQGEAREVEYETVKWVNGNRQINKAKCKVQDRTCRAWAIEKATGDRLDGPEVSIAMAEAEGWLGKNGSKWQTMPEVMLRYRAAAFFGKLYAPELLMGLQTVEEAAEVIDVTPVDLSAVVDAPARPQRSDFTTASTVVDVEAEPEPDPFVFTDADGEVYEYAYASEFVRLLVASLERAGDINAIEGIWETNSGQLDRVRAANPKLADEAHEAYGLALDRAHLAAHPQTCQKTDAEETPARVLERIMAEMESSVTEAAFHAVGEKHSRAIADAGRADKTAYKAWLARYDAKLSALRAVEG